VTPGKVLYLSQDDVAAIDLALDDMATAIRIYHRALELGIGTELPL